MNKEKRVETDSVLNFLHKVGPEIWERICGECEETIGGNYLYGGYYIIYDGVFSSKDDERQPKSYIKIVAKLDLPENERALTDHKSVDGLVREAVDESKIDKSRYSLSASVWPRHPMMVGLEDDLVFGTNPEIPNEVEYKIFESEKESEVK